MFGIAIDLGYRYTKGLNENGDRFLTLSLVGSASRRLTELFDTESEEDLHVEVDCNKIRGGKAEAFVGELASRESRTASGAFDTNKIYHPNTAILLACAAGKLIPKNADSIHLVSGLPVEDYYKQKNEFKKYLEDFNAKITYLVNGKPSETKEVKFDKITLFPQGAGAIYHALATHRNYFERGYYIGLVDIGMRTTDIVVFDTAEKFRIRPQFCRTLEIGVLTLYQEVIARVNDKLGSNFDTMNMIDRIMQNAKGFYYKGEKHDITNLIYDAKQKVARAIKDRLVETWGNELDTFRVVFLAGGGSIELHSYFKDFHGTTILLDNSQFSNVYGYMKVHEAVLRRLKENNHGKVIAMRAKQEKRKQVNNQG